MGFLSNFCSFGYSVSEENFFFKLTYGGHVCYLIGINCAIYRGPSIDASYQVSVHLAKRFQRRRSFSRNRPIRNKNFLWRPCLLNDRDELSNLYRTFHRCSLPSFCSFGQAVSEETIYFRNRPIRNKNYLWPPCLLTDRVEMSNCYRGPSIDAPYQVSVHLAKWFERRILKYERLTDDKRQMLTLPLAR